MKLFKYEDRHEGCRTPADVIICFGKQIEGKDYHNGWHLTVILPFIKKNVKNYVDPMTFDTRSERCSFHFRIIRRKFRGRQKYSNLYCQAWQPIKKEKTCY